MVQPRAAEKGVVLSYHVASDAITCVADERRLRQMLLNLLSNALKFTPQGQVTLTVQGRDALVEFGVEDTGIGIPADRLEQIFQPFTQLDHNLNRQYDGAGLGLALSRQLAQLHGGQMRVESAVGRAAVSFSTCRARVPMAPPLLQRPGTEIRGATTGQKASDWSSLTAI
jgi:signal transduction histidine kinase